MNHYNINSGVLDFDDSGKKRSKRTTRITGAHKVKDKATGGYFNGQQLVFMVLVTDVVTIPVGFRFF
ncbi:transposase, partial [Pseudoalteromonas aurantia]